MGSGAGWSSRGSGVGRSLRRPKGEGIFVLRVKMPKGHSIAPHMHVRAEHVTVISGKFLLGLGESRSITPAWRTSPLGFSSMPKGVVHYVFVDEDSIIQINAVGPWDIDYVNPKDDPRLMGAGTPKVATDSAEAALIRSASQAEGNIARPRASYHREVQVMEEDHAFHQILSCLPRLQEIRVWDDERACAIACWPLLALGSGLCTRETAAFTGRSAPKQRPLVKSRAANIQQNTVADRASRTFKATVGLWWSYTVCA